MAGLVRFLAKGWRIRFIWPLLLLLAAFVVFLEVIVDFGGHAQVPTPNPATIPFPRDDPRLVPAQVLSVIDGDTIEADLGDGRVAVRYYGSDAPERGEPCFDEAGLRNRTLVEGQRVFLLPDARDRDEGGRLLRYVFTEDGRLLDALLISEGFARAWRRDGAYHDDLIVMERAAADNRLGCLWSR